MWTYLTGFVLLLLLSFSKPPSIWNICLTRKDNITYIWSQQYLPEEILRYISSFCWAWRNEMMFLSENIWKTKTLHYSSFLVNRKLKFRTSRGIPQVNFTPVTFTPNVLAAVDCGECKAEIEVVTLTNTALNPSVQFHVVITFMLFCGSHRSRVFFRRLFKYKDDWILG